YSALLESSWSVPAGTTVSVQVQLGNSGVYYPDEFVSLRMAAAGGTPSYTSWWPITGVSGIGHVTAQAPSTAPEGWNTSQLTVDYADRLPESNESNNSSYVNLFVTRCGNGVCAGTENCSTCPADCGACGWCGDGFCNAGENCNTCPDDCGDCPNCFVAGTPI